MLLLVLMISAANCHFNYNRIAASSHSDPAAYNQQPIIRQPTYHYYPMTFFSKSPYSYQTTSKPYYATPLSLAVTKSPTNPSDNGMAPNWYRHSASTYDRPAAVFNYQFFGPNPQTVHEDRSLYSTPELDSPAELAEPIELVENLDPVIKVTDSALLMEAEASGDDVISTTDATELQVSTESDVQDSTTNSQDDEGLLSTATEDDVTTPALAQVTEIEVETTTVLDDMTTVSDETESPITFERHQSIIPFYLRPSAWRSRSFGPDPRYYQPNHYYGPEEARESSASSNLFL